MRKPARCTIEEVGKRDTVGLVGLVWYRNSSFGPVREPWTDRDGSSSGTVQEGEWSVVA